MDSKIGATLLRCAVQSSFPLFVQMLNLLSDSNPLHLHISAQVPPSWRFVIVRNGHTDQMNLGQLRTEPTDTEKSDEATKEAPASPSHSIDRGCGHSFIHRSRHCSV
jgi:hypothetical protein